MFLGVLAGALIQYWLSQIQFRKHQANARLVLETEIDLNLIEANAIKARISFLKERVASGQIEQEELFFNMQAFDYSAIGPLVNSGHFHAMLGSEGVKKYLEFMRYFNNDNANNLNSMLHSEYEKNKSMAFLDWMLQRCDELSSGLLSLRKQA